MLWRLRSCTTRSAPSGCAMADADPQLSPRASALAAWTQLPDAKLGECYVTVWRSGRADEWQVVVAKHGGALAHELCRQADLGGFLEPFARAIVNWERLAGRANAEIVDMLDTVVGYGVMQGMSDQQKGFMSAEILLPMLQARDSCAIVVHRKPVRSQLGTGFLVTPDLIFTSAHVVMDVEGAAGAQSWVAKLKDNLAFEFKARPNEPQTNRVEILAAAKDALVSFALPYGSPPNRLEQSLDPPDVAASNLDFALIRLAQRVDHVTPVDIAAAGDFEQGKPCWLFGFPPGSALMMDVDVVEEIKNGAGRWIHRANSANGMSGGCCLNHIGQIAGLHEGTQQIGGGARNRGISLRAIRTMQKKSGKDPLVAMPTAEGLEFRDESLVKDLYQAGLRLGGEALAAGWRQQLNAALGTGDVETGPIINTFHPSIARPPIENWIASTNPDSRLCLVHGGPGVGKSFCTHILRARGQADGSDFLALTPTHLNAMSWADAISQLLVPEGSQYRTAAATVRYRDFDEVVGEMRSRSLGGTRPYYVAMDFGPPGNDARFIGTQWVEFVAALAVQPWIRIMVIDLSAIERAAIGDHLAAASETRDVIVTEPPIHALDRADLMDFARKLVTARGRDLPPNEVRDRVNALLPASLDFSGPWQPMQTVSVAAAAIAFEAGL
jgi:hypothetical protein